MKVTIKNANLSGSVRVPSSKSEAHRYLICAALADTVTDVEIYGICSDIEATAECLSALGATLERTEYGYRVTPVKNVNMSCHLRCRDSGSTLRFLIPVSAALGTNSVFYMEGKLHERPLSPLDAELDRHGVTLTKYDRTLTVNGKLCAQDFTIDAGVSSQFISGILMALPLMGGGRVVLEGKVESADYIRLTVDAMRAFGVDVTFDGTVIEVPCSSYASPGKVTAAGDWSGASFWVAAGALSDEGITCMGVDLTSTQGDRRIVDVVRAMGADVTFGDSCVTVKKNKLRAHDIDGTHIPDAIPVISVLASLAEGRSVISGASRLRLKESDRLAVMTEVLTSMGGTITEHCDGMVINGKRRLASAVIDSHNDHRVAMSAAVASISADGEVTVRGAECVSKSYSSFWEDFVSLGAVIESCKE